jgi:hypothetical protein
VAKKYKTQDGDYLTVIEDGHAHRVAWFVAEHCDIGLFVGDDFEADKEKECPTDKGDWECWVASHSAAPFSDRSDSQGFVFDAAVSAKKALRAANEALLRGDKKPMPGWALKAKDAGWTPPEGWKP